MMFGFVEKGATASSRHVVGSENPVAGVHDDAAPDWAGLVLDGDCPTAMLGTLLFPDKTRGDAGSRRRPTLVQ